MRKFAPRVIRHASSSPRPLPRGGGEGEIVFSAKLGLRQNHTRVLPQPQLRPRYVGNHSALSVPQRWGGRGMDLFRLGGRDHGETVFAGSMNHAGRPTSAPRRFEALGPTFRFGGNERTCQE